MPEKLRWGIISTGLIAAELTDGVKGSQTGELYAVASRDQSKADAFAKKNDIPRAYGSYEAMLADPDVQCVYVATPHPMHAEWTIKSCEAGKHVLVEKPIGLNQYEAMAMIDAARAHDVFLMEAFMYRCHPWVAHVRELLTQQNVIGEVKMIHAEFAYQAPFNPEARTYNMQLGGGGILDVGCYPVSASRLIAGMVAGKPFVDPVEVRGVGRLGKTGTDDWAIASLKFPSGIVAEVTTGVNLRTGSTHMLSIYGAEGRIDLTNPWTPSRWNRDPVPILVTRYDEKEPQRITVDAPDDLYAYEADMVGRHIAARQAPAMSWDDTIGNMRTLDRWRTEIGFVYEMEKWPALAKATVANRPLKRHDPSPMKYGRIPGLGKPVSRLVFGCATINAPPDAAIMLDAYFEHGGNAFDTSYGYGNPNGATERNLAAWIRSRGVRDQVVVIEKGGNPPYVTPQGVEYEFTQGLERLEMDRVDLYVIHRDNEQVPIGEWVDLLNRHLRAGHMSAFGLSNFSIPRLDAFNAYAKQHSLATFSVVSNNFSLAEVKEIIWSGFHLVSSSDKSSRAWFERTKTPLMPWSSQAQGFFARAARDKLDDPEMVRCWYDDANFARLDRAQELARKRNAEPVNIALAYVLNQPFPTFPIIGPRRPAEVASCVRALKINLSPEELRFLAG